MAHFLPPRKLIVALLIYAVAFLLLAKWLPWFFFIPLAAVVIGLHIFLQERGKHRRYRAIVRGANTARIEGYPSLSNISGRDIDDVVMESLAEISAELEKKCYQLVEKNIQLLSLKEISLTIISSLNETRIVDSVESFLSRGLGFKEILVGIFDADLNSLHVYTFRDAFGESIRKERIVALDELQGFLRKSVMTRKPILIRDPAMHPLGSTHDAQMFADSTMHSYLLVPMIKSKFSQQCWKAENCVLRNRAAAPLDPESVEDARCPACGRLPILGVIGVTDGFKAASLSQVDLVAVETLALQISTLLENSQLYSELQKGEAFRDNVINSMISGLITVDTEGSVLLSNQSAEAMSGYSANELKGMHIDALMIDSPSDDNEGPVTRTLRQRTKSFQKEAWLVRKDGRKLPITLNTTFLVDEDKQIQGALAVFNDLTRIKRMEQKILHLDKLAALGRFSSSMAHEIRNPLTGIVAGLQYLRRVGGIADDQEENMSFILSEVNRIDRLIRDILNVVRVSDLVYQPVQVESLVKTSITSVSDLARKRSITLESEFPERTRTVMVDSDRITQVLINILKNAVEASPDGGKVRVRVSFPLEVGDVLFDDVRNLVIIEVEDQGVGFSQDEKARLFEPFFTTKPDGTGLGLYVAHSVVERHGGYILVESEKGTGSIFSIYLPVEKVHYGNADEVGHPVGR